MRSTRSCLITSLQQLHDVVPVWDALWRSCPHATPFQSPAWLVPWWEHFHPGELHAFAIESEGELVGLAPFYRDGDLLKFLGIGISDYLDGLCQHGFEEALLSCIDQPAELRQLRPCSLFFSDDSEPDEPCPVAKVGVLPKRMRENIRYYTRRAEREGSIEWDQSNALELLEALIDLHTASWEGRGGKGVFADPMLRAFHRRAVPRLLNTGMLRMHGLRLSGRLIGVLYGFLHERTLYYYLSGFSPDHQHLSPGTLLLAHAIECAGAEGATTVNFLRGEESYKFLWGARSQPTYRRMIDPRHIPDWTEERPHVILSRRD